MDLQTIFYVVGIITMTLYTLLLLAIVIVIFLIKKRVTEASRKAEAKINEIKTMADLGSTIADSAIRKAADLFGVWKKKSSN